MTATFRRSCFQRMKSAQGERVAEAVRVPRWKAHEAEGGRERPAKAFNFANSSRSGPRAFTSSCPPSPIPLIFIEPAPIGRGYSLSSQSFSDSRRSEEDENDDGRRAGGSLRGRKSVRWMRFCALVPHNSRGPLSWWWRPSWSGSGIRISDQNQDQGEMITVAVD
ncbi:hypothetical protein TYRP_015941 [Tyrophagus putrescentiae]|nr:hypothetical protein TYRP_015941 [Tyrophagus putrescentiae]